MVADGAGSLEVKPITTPNLCLFGNAHFGNRSLHTESGNMVKQNDVFGHYEPQVNSTQHGMEAPLRPLLFGGITNTPSAMEPPQFYGSWSTCGDDAHSAFSFPDHIRKRTQENVSHFGHGPDVLGLVANILEEPNKQEHVTDWNSLSRLFPPVWSSNFENYGSFSGLFPVKSLESENCNSASSQKLCEENKGKPSSVELFNKECEDLHVIRSQFPPSQPFMPSPHELSKMANLDNNASKNGGICLFNYEKKHNGSTSASRPQMKDSTNTYREFPKINPAGSTEGSSKYFAHLSNAAADRIWDPMTKENSLCAKRAFSAAHDSGHFSFSQSLNKENSFPEGMDVKFQEICPQNHSNSTNFVHTECKNPVHPGKGSSQQLPLKPAVENMDSPYNGYTWLDAKIQNPMATSSVMYGKEMQINSQLSSGPQSRGLSANESATQSPHSPMLSSGKDRKLQFFTDYSSNSGYSGCSGIQKQHNPLGPSHSDSVLRAEGGFGKMPLTASSSCKSQQYSTNASAQYHRYHIKQNRNNTDEKTGQNERRHKNSWSQHMGFPGPDRTQFDILRRNQEQNGAILPDYVNPSFLPLFPLVSGYKHLPHFPPFPPPFPSPFNAAAFSLLPFPLSELVDLFRFEDFSHISPFISDFCGGDNTAAPYFAFPPPLNHYRPPKNRSGPANELHIHLEECYEQLRALERECKKAEADLARHFPGKRVSSSSNAPFSRLPAKPSRVDRLIVDQFREQAKVYTLIEKMEHISGSPVHRNISATLGRHLEAIWATQARRKAEVVNSVNPQRQRTSRHHNERDILALAAAIKDLAFFTRKTRTALWCALQMTLPKTPGSALAKKEEVERALQDLCPTDSNFQAKNASGHEGKPSRREGHDEGRQVSK